MRRDDPYYLGNEDTPAVQLILECEGVTITKELHWDLSGDDLCEAFYAMLSYFCDPLDVLKAMKAYGSKSLLHDTFYNCQSFVAPFSVRLAYRAGSDRGNMEIKLDGRRTGIDLCKAFHTLCIGLTFHSDSVYEMMEEFADDNLPQPKEESTNDNDNEN